METAENKTVDQKFYDLETLRDIRTVIINDPDASIITLGTFAFGDAEPRMEIDILVSRQDVNKFCYTIYTQRYLDLFDRNGHSFSLGAGTQKILRSRKVGDRPNDALDAEFFFT